MSGPGWSPESENTGRFLHADLSEIRHERQAKSRRLRFGVQRLQGSLRDHGRQSERGEQEARELHPRRRRAPRPHSTVPRTTREEV